MAAFRNILSLTSSMTNGTRGLLEVVVRSGELQIKYIEDVFDRLEVQQRKRSKRDLNPLYIVGDLADWTFGEDYIFKGCTFSELEFF